MQKEGKREHDIKQLVSHIRAMPCPNTSFCRTISHALPLYFIFLDLKGFWLSHHVNQGLPLHYQQRFSTDLQYR